jgi:hypothetical protein
MEIQGGSSGGDHAWETSFGESDLSDHRNASHFGNNPDPKTMTLFLKRGTNTTSLVLWYSYAYKHFSRIPL